MMMMMMMMILSASWLSVCKPGLPMDIHEILYLCIFPKSVEKFQESLKSDKNNWYFAWWPLHIYGNILLISSSNYKYFRQNFCRGYQNTFCVQ
jgi:hypothetical protein